MTTPLPADASLGIYVHIPFCARVCPYCDFNTYANQEELIPTYVEALIAEMDLMLAKYGPRPAATIYFGGGTPSLLAPEQIARLIAALRTRFPLPDDAEVSLEANPESLDAETLAGFLRAGVNRISLGVQTQQRHGLKVLGRGHRPEIPERALAAARAAGAGNLSVDFIFGWPGQTAEDWERDLDALIDWGAAGAVGHASLYSLIVEPGTPLEDAVRRGILILSDDDAAANLYERAIARLAAAGWHHYEISNWARAPGYASRHNLIYWRNGYYLGLGAGAHGHVDDTRSSNMLIPARYIRTVRDGQLPIAFQERLDAATVMGETMMLGLRLVEEGVSATAFEIRHGRKLEDVYGRQLEDLTQVGLLTWDGAHARLTHWGLMVANVVEERFLPEGPHNALLARMPSVNSD